MNPDRQPADQFSRTSREVDQRPDLVVTYLGQVLQNYPDDGPDAIERAIVEERDCYADGFASDCLRSPALATPEKYRASQGDQVIWRGREVVAILRPRLDGRMDVIRL